MGASKLRCRCYKNARDSFIKSRKNHIKPCPVHETSIVTPEEMKTIEIERATFVRDLRAYAEYLKTIAHVHELRRQNPKWRVI